MNTDTEPIPAGSTLLPHWMYSQIISDDSARTVWCYCDAPAISYCRGLQFVCLRGHAGVPGKMLKPRNEQKWFDEQRAKALEMARQQAEEEEAKRLRRRRKTRRPEQC